MVGTQQWTLFSWKAGLQGNLDFWLWGIGQVNCSKRKQQTPTVPYLILEIKLRLGRNTQGQNHTLPIRQGRHISMMPGTQAALSGVREPHFSLSSPQKGVPPGGFISDLGQERRGSTGGNGPPAVPLNWITEMQQAGSRPSLDLLGKTEYQIFSSNFPNYEQHGNKAYEV